MRVAYIKVEPNKREPWIKHTTHNVFIYPENLWQRFVLFIGRMLLWQLKSHHNLGGDCTLLLYKTGYDPVYGEQHGEEVLLGEES